MTRYRTILLAIASAIVTIIAAVTVNLAASQTSSWSSVSLVVILSIVTLSLGIFQVFDKTQEVREKRKQEQSHPLKITLEIDGESITIETSNVDQVKKILKLVRGLQANDSSRVNFGRENVLSSLVANIASHDITDKQKLKAPESSEASTASQEHSEDQTKTTREKDD
jgi:Na+/melibiose symporter-like transporter